MFEVEDACVRRCVYVCVHVCGSSNDRRDNSGRSDKKCHCKNDINSGASSIQWKRWQKRPGKDGGPVWRRDLRDENSQVWSTCHNVCDKQNRLGCGFEYFDRTSLFLI